MYLVIVDTTQIQPYIFGSNRLRENIGASHLVAQATEQWAFEALPHPHNVNVGPKGKLDEAQQIEVTLPQLAAEVIYAGGGNVIVLFRDEPQAKAFTQKLSRKVLTDAPGLQLVIARQPFEWSEPLYEKVKLTFQTLAEKKRARAHSVPLLGLGVTAMCESTGLPAIGVTQKIGDDEGYPASAEIHAKLAVATSKGTQPSEAGKRLLDLIPPLEGYDYPNDFKYLGGTRGEHSYIAVVHADGNGMGQRIMDIGKKHATADNRKYITDLRRFSDAVEAAARKAMNDTLSKLVSRINDGEVAHSDLNWLKVRLATNKDNNIKLLPFRPIVFGGDDVTFVCDGRLGLSLVVEYLRQFENETAKRADCKGKITACAGIAIVKTHYPFARAYTLAEELCKSAKIYRRKQNLDGSCLDWHFASSGLSGSIEKIREREYKVSAGDLTLRPMTLAKNPEQAHRSWEVVLAGADEFQRGWSGRRNKVKALRDALREGGTAVESFLMNFNESRPLPDVCTSMADWKEQGWQGKYCGYFDAVEMIDWFIPL